MRRIFVCLQGVATGAWPRYVTVGATLKTDKKTRKADRLFPENRLTQIKNRGLEIPVVVITGHGDEMLASQMLHSGALIMCRNVNSVQKPLPEPSMLLWKKFRSGRK
ncbi:MAG: hypothetical protein GY801_39975 [bacterium]|nr:hypothetical protein [bacterium]